MIFDEGNEGQVSAAREVASIRLAPLNQAKELFIKRKIVEGDSSDKNQSIAFINYNPKRARPSSVLIEKSTPCKSSASEVHK